MSPISETDRTVVSLAPRSRALHRAPLDLIEGHWQSLRVGHELPLRSAVDPRRIQDALEYAFVAERVTDTNLRLRVAGSHLNDLAGMAVAGMPLASLCNTTGRLHLVCVLRDLFRGPCMARVEMVSAASVWGDAMSAELLLLPMLGEDGEVSRVLGGLVTQGRIGKTPRKFDVTHVTLTRLGLPQDTPVAQAAQARRGYLSLVVSND